MVFGGFARLLGLNEVIRIGPLGGINNFIRGRDANLHVAVSTHNVLHCVLMRHKTLIEAGVMFLNL